jgi:hypothetical protein
MSASIPAVVAKGQSTSEKLMARDAIPKSNAEAGQRILRILKDASTGGPVFKTFADFLGAAAMRKVQPIDMRLAVPDSVSANPDLVYQKRDDYELKLKFFTPITQPKSTRWS